MTFGSIDSPTNEWTGWLAVASDPGVVFLVSRLKCGEIRENFDIGLRKLELPDGYSFCGPLRTTDGAFRFLATSDSEMLVLGVHGDGQAESLRTDVLSAYPLKDSGGLLDRYAVRRIDVDGDGADDVVELHEESFDVYVQGRQGSLEHRCRVASKMPLVRHTALVSDVDSVPTIACILPEIWMEPASDRVLSDMVIAAFGTTGRFAQTSEGVFEWSGEVAQHALQQRIRTRLTPSGPVGILESVLEPEQRGVRSASIVWCVDGKTEKRANFTSVLTAPFLADMDGDGATEVVVLEVPAMRQAIEDWIRKPIASFRCVVSVLQCDPESETWVKSKAGEASVQFSRREYRVAENVDARVLVGVDLNADGYGDVAILSGCGSIDCLLMPPAHDSSQEARRLAIPTGLAPTAIQPAFSGRGPVGLLVQYASVESSHAAKASPRWACILLPPSEGRTTNRGVPDGR